MKKLLITAATLAIFAPIGCSSHNNHEKEVVKLEVTKPLKQNTALSRDYVSQIRSIQRIELRALEKGYVSKVHVDEGQYVEAGTLLFEVMPRLYQAELDKAQAEYDFAKIEYENTEKLRKDNVIAASELNLAKAKLDKAKAELSLAQVRLGFTEIRAPFNGITGRLEVRQGSLVEEGELLTSLSDNHQMWVYFNVPEAEYLEFKKTRAADQGAEVKLRMANHEVYDHAGKITAIEADFNNETGNIAFRATFPNPEGILRHGQTGNVVLDVPFKNALLIPQKATFEILDKRFVYVVDQKHNVRSKRITVSAEIPDLFVVGDGLKEEDTILIDGLRKVRDGDSIEPKFKSPKMVMASLQVRAE